jgi:hypothetical protein
MRTFTVKPIDEMETINNGITRLVGGVDLGVRVVRLDESTCLSTPPARTRASCRLCALRNQDDSRPLTERT